MLLEGDQVRVAKRAAVMTISERFTLVVLAIVENITLVDVVARRLAYLIIQYLANRARVLPTQRTAYIPLFLVD